MIKRSAISMGCYLSLLTTPAFVFASELSEVITVTAQKREQALQDVGIAITAFSGEQLEELGLDNAQQITNFSPGVTTIQPNGPASFFTSIRGVGQNDFSGDHQESPVAVYLDEVYISAASGAGFQLFDMKRAEVIRGPQGTLFGRNATGGLVHYITNTPTQDNEGYVNLTLADFNQTRLEGAVSGGLTESVAGRLSFVRNKHDPFIKNRIGKDLNNGDDWALRGQLLFDINDQLEWNISVRAGEQDIDSGFFEHSSARSDPATGLGLPFDGPDLQSEGDSLVSGFEETGDDVSEGAYNVIGYNRVETVGATSKIVWVADDFDFVSITDYQTLEKDYLEDTDASPNDFFAFFLKTDLTQFSQEFRVSGDINDIRWVAGLFHLDIDGEFSNGGAAANFFRAAFPGFGLEDPAFDTLGLNSPFSTDTQSTAIFGQIEYEFADDFTLHTGLRVTKEKKEVDYVQYLSLFESADSSVVSVLDAFELGGPIFSFNQQAVTNAPAVGFFADSLITGNTDDTKLNENLVTAKLQLDWKPNDQTLTYFSFNRGVKAGGFNAPTDATLYYVGAIPTSGMQFDEEILNAFEVGVKWTSGSGNVRINGSTYYYDYQDYQAFALDNLTTYIFNTDAEVSGGELEIYASPAKGLDILMGIAYIDNNVEDAYTLPSGSPIDRRAVMTPKINANALVRYEWTALNGTLAAQLDATYMGEHYFQLKNSPVGEEDAYVLSNARVSYTSANEQWVLTAFVNNLADTEYRTNAIDLSGSPTAGGFGIVNNYYGTPRWWGVSANYKWE
jgi:iron complex outermembrane receptor protein